MGAFRPRPSGKRGWRPDGSTGESQPLAVLISERGLEEETCPRCYVRTAGKRQIKTSVISLRSFLWVFFLFVFLIVADALRPTLCKCMLQKQPVGVLAALKLFFAVNEESTSAAVANE